MNGYCMPASGDRTDIVTIDGPAGVGKSTLAKRVAAALGIAYLDTGAMFRTIALGLSGPVEAGRPPSGAELERLLSGFVFTLEGRGLATLLLCNGQPVGSEIRSEKAGMMAAKVAAWPEVRACLKAAQQRLGTLFPLVAEGRDTGTVIFPQARCKIFLDASPEVRARRRFLQLEQAGRHPGLAELTEQIRLRDERDRTRDIAPLRPAPDACIIDTSDRDIDAVFAAIMEVATANGFNPR